MSSVSVLSPQGEPLTRAVELPGAVFDVAVNVPLLHQVVTAQLAAARRGTHDTKTRGEVRGGGSKPYRQKGTGRARQGSVRAPQFAGGGTVFGPTPRDYTQKTPKKMKAAALRGALSDRARGGRVHVIEALVVGEVPSTRSAVAALSSVTDRRRVLLVADRRDELTWKSLRNVASVHLIAPGQLNTYDVLVSDDVVFTESGLVAFLAGQLGGESSATPSGPGVVGPAADDVDDGELARQVAGQTSSDLGVEQLFEREAGGTEVDNEVAKASADQVAAEGTADAVTEVSEGTADAVTEAREGETDDGKAGQ